MPMSYATVSLCLRDVWIEGKDMEGAQSMSARCLILRSFDKLSGMGRMRDYVNDLGMSG